ncbi:MAG TPA: ATP synthase F1 subunit gamma [Candidatus Paceibacterota bacterium]|nr:ATP synthase F1 subunit gamma [Candidatus Paceibacterota bacterium]
MASLKNIKLKILSYKKTGTVTHAMEAVSAVKMRKSQERALSTRAYAAAALSILERLSSVADLQKHYLFSEGSGTKVCFVVITSDKGLAGALNSGVLRLTEQEISRRGLSKENVLIVAVGRRATEYFRSRGYNVVGSYINISDDVSQQDASDISNALVGLKEQNEIKECYLIYQNFISTFEQHPSVRQIIPIRSETIKQMVANIRPARGKYAPQPSETLAPAPAAYTFEPDAEQVVSQLPQILLNIAVFHGLLENKASEHSARMVAMKSATDKAKDMTKSYTRIFNRVRQAAITREVSEITSGIEAMH